MGDKQLRTESVDIEGRIALGLGRGDLVLGAVEIEGDNLQVEIVGQGDLDGLVDGQQVRRLPTAPGPRPAVAARASGKSTRQCGKSQKNRLETQKRYPSRKAAQIALVSASN